MDGEPVICDVGYCTDEATRRVEIRRSPIDRYPAEVRPICWDSSCSHLVRQSAAGFSVQIVKGLSCAPSKA